MVSTITFFFLLIFSHFVCDRCRIIFASMSLAHTLPSPALRSRYDLPSHCLTTSSSAFLSFSHSLIHFFSSHRMTMHHLYLLTCTFFEISPTLLPLWLFRFLSCRAWQLLTSIVVYIFPQPLTSFLWRLHHPCIRSIHQYGVTTGMYTYLLDIQTPLYISSIPFSLHSITQTKKLNDFEQRYVINI